MAEETDNPEVQIPLAMQRTIYIGMGAALFLCLALILGLPDIKDAIHGQDPDPVGAVLRASFGAVGSRWVIVVVLVSFMSCILSVQAAASRLLFSYARDNMIVGSWRLSRLSGQNVPSFALVVSGVIPGAIVCIGYFLQNALATILSFAVAGIYISFLMIMAGALYARVRGWKALGPFNLGRFSFAVNIAALVYGVCAIVDIFWPQTPGTPWYINYAIPFTTVIIIGTGALYMSFGRPYDRGSAPAGDAAASRKSLA